MKTTSLSHKPLDFLKIKLAFGKLAKTATDPMTFLHPG